MTMQFSAYQIESLLDDYQQENFPSDRSASENLSLSQEAINVARHHFSPSASQASIWKSPKEVIELIEDKTEYDPVIDFVQQSRAGRFVDPVFYPDNSPPAFSLVTDYSQDDKKGLVKDQEGQENEITEKNLLNSKPGSDTARINGQFFINEAETKKDLPHSDQIKMSISEIDPDSNSSNISETDFVKLGDEENIYKKSGDNEIELTRSKKDPITSSAARLFEKIEEGDLDEEFEFDEKGLNDGDNADNDIVFGDGQINSNSISRFVKNFPESAIKFMFRKNLDGRNLPVEYEEIYINWEKRGLSRGRLKKYLFKLMKWDNFPDIPVLEVLQRIKDRQYDLKGKN